MQPKKLAELVILPAAILLLMEIPFWGSGNTTAFAIIIPVGAAVVAGVGYFAVKRHGDSEVSAGIAAAWASVLYNAMKGVAAIAIIYIALRPDALLPPVVLFEAAFYAFWIIEGAVSGFVLGWLGAKIANAGAAKR